MIKDILKSLLYGVILTLIMVFIALLIKSFSGYLLRDILFIEGIVFLILAVISSIGGNPLGLSTQGLCQQNAQYISNQSLTITKKEKELLKNMKYTISIGLNTVSLFVSGVFLITLNFII